MKALFSVLTIAGAMFASAVGAGALSMVHTVEAQAYAQGVSRVTTPPSGVCAKAHSETCAKAVAHAIQAKVGTGMIACYYEASQAGHMRCYVFAHQARGADVVIRDNRWSIGGRL